MFSFVHPARARIRAVRHCDGVKSARMEVRMDRGVRWRLSGMMFLQYMAWGTWYPVLSAYLERIGFNGNQIRNRPAVIGGPQSAAS
jgi:hypothetical protein